MIWDGGGQLSYDWRRTLGWVALWQENIVRLEHKTWGEFFLSGPLPLDLPLPLQTEALWETRNTTRQGPCAPN